MDKKGQKPPKPALPQALVEALKGREITVQVSSGTIYSGKFEGLIDEFIVLSSATVIGKRWRAETRFLALRANNISHIHLKPERLEEIAEA